MTQALAEVRSVSRWRVCVAALGIFTCTGGPSYYASFRIFNTGGSAVVWTNLYPFLAVAVAGIVLLVLCLSRMTIREVPWPMYAVAGYATWALLSATWSSSPLASPMAAVIDLGLAAFGCWIALTCSIEEQVTSVMLATVAAVALSVPVIAWWPKYGREPILGPGAGGEWMGIFGNRNSLSAVCVLGIIAAAGYFALRPSLRRGQFAVAVSAVHLVVLWGTQGDTSRIALVLCVLAAAGIPLLWKLRSLRVPGYVVSAAAVAALIAAWIVFFDNLDSIAAKVGMDPTLSRRTLIWRHVRAFIRVHPYRGYGYWAFWENPALTQGTYYSVGSAYGSAHNSVLEVLLGLGAIGLVFYLCVVLAAIVGISRWLWTAPSVASWWWGVVLVYLVAQNLTESFVLWHSYNWMLFVSASVVPFVQHTAVTTADAERSSSAMAE